MKGILMLGGKGTRLYPASKFVNKQLLPIAGKPIFFYSLSILLLSGITEICIIINSDDKLKLENLIGNGSKYGLNIEYRIQDSPNGIPEGISLAEDFIGNDTVCLMLGDNIFYSHELVTSLKEMRSYVETLNEASVVSYMVQDPTRFGIVNLDSRGKAINLEEKPSNPKSNKAVTGLYMYPSDVFNKVKTLTPSKRGELEITDLNRLYMQEDRLNVLQLGRGSFWIDAGTQESFLKANNFLNTIEEIQKNKIGSIEEIVYKNNIINDTMFESLIKEYDNSDYAKYLLEILNAKK